MIKVKIPRIRIGLLVALLLTPLLASCGPSSPPVVPRIEAPLDSPATLPVVTFSPLAPGRWKELNATCPTLKTKVPGFPAAVGEGTPGPSHLDTILSLSAECFWKTDGERQRDVTVSVIVIRDSAQKSVEQRAIEYFRQQAEDARREAAKYPDIEIQPRAEPRLGDEAFLSLALTFKKLSLTVRSANAVISVAFHLQRLEPDPKVPADRLMRYRPAALTVARDVLDDLR